MLRQLQGPQTNSKLVILYMSNIILHPLLIFKWEYSFQMIEFLTCCSAVVENTINGKSMKVNIGDI